MQKTIWKFPLEITDRQAIEIPAGGHILSAGLDPSHVPSVWALVDPKRSNVKHTIVICGTGRPVPKDVGRFIGSFVHLNAFVWHVFTA